MRQVWKFPLEVTDVQDIQMPDLAKPISVQVQGKSRSGAELVMLWAVVESASTPSTRRIRIAGTGHDLNPVGEFIDTFQLEEGRLVFHVFDLGVVSR